VELAEVEVGGRGEHRGLLRFLDPAEELLLPGPERDSPGWVGGHDVARAADEPALLEGGRQVLGQGGEPAIGPRWGAIGHHQGVVLVGAERALPAGPAAQDEERVRAWGRPERRLAVASGADIEGIVGAGQEPGDIGGRGAGPDQPGRGRGGLTGGGGQLLGAGRPVEPAADEQGMVGLLPEQVGVGDDPDQLSLPGEGQVVDAPVDHGEQHLVEGAVGRDGVQRRGHDLAYRGAGMKAGREHAVAEVGGGHQARRPAVDDQRRHQPVAHAPGRLGDGVVRGAGDDRLAGQGLGSD
jgi:hypothetical protein